MPVCGQCDKRMLLGALCQFKLGHDIGSLRQLTRSKPRRQAAWTSSGLFLSSGSSVELHCPRMKCSTNSFSVGKHVALTGLGDDLEYSIQRHSTTDRTH